MVLSLFPKIPEQVQLGTDYVRRVHSGQFDWFMRVDDDAFVIMENLIMFLRTRNTTAPEIYGAHMKFGGGFVSTGAGLTMSAHNFDINLLTALGRVDCPKDNTHHDDVRLANCLKSVCLM